MPGKPFLIVCVSTFAVTLLVLGVLSRDDSRGASSPSAGSTQTRQDSRSTQARILKLEQSVRQRPRDAEALVRLSGALLQGVRETGDVSAYDRADRIVARALRIDPSSAAAYAERGILRLARHEFRGALSDGRRARRLAPGLVAPLGVIADAEVELGRYDDAKRTLQRMVDLKPNLASYTRVSYYRELHGDLDGASVVLSLASSAGGEAPENVAFVQSLLGNIELAQGRPQRARRAFRTALAKLPRYAPAEAGLARLDIAAGRLEPAIARLRRVVDRLPSQEYVVSLGEAQIAAGHVAEGRRTLELVRAGQRLQAAAGVNTDAELAIFEADYGDPARAVKLARAAWGNAPSVRSADALGWALTRAGRAREGLRYARRALRLGSRDASFLYHAGMNARAAGRKADAQRFLRNALAADPGFSPVHASTARRVLDRL
jgi:tetratricopeptide (TPR) repeat protein